MGFEIDTSLSWTEHYVKYGFAVLKGLVDRPFCAEALAEIRELVGETRPVDEWTSEKPGQRYTVVYHGQSPVLDRIYQRPRLLAALHELLGDDGVRFGSTDPTDPERRHFALWLNPYDPKARPRLNPLGHIDSGSPYRGLSFHLSLVDTEPFSGNTTFFPGTHKLIHAALRANPDPEDKGGIFPQVPRLIPPYEFVAEAGDVAFVHHLLCHTGNPSHSPNRLPRVVLRVEAFTERERDITDFGNDRSSAWARSYA